MSLEIFLYVDDKEATSAAATSFQLDDIATTEVRSLLVAQAETPSECDYLVRRALEQNLLSNFAKKAITGTVTLTTETDAYGGVQSISVTDGFIALNTSIANGGSPCRSFVITSVTGLLVAAGTICKITSVVSKDKIFIDTLIGTTGSTNVVGYVPGGTFYKRINWTDAADAGGVGNLLVTGDPRVPNPSYGLAKGSSFPTNQAGMIYQLDFTAA